VAVPRIDREVRRQGERPLFEALGAQRLFAKWLIASPDVGRPSKEEQATLPSNNRATAHG
jgi:hypothetical protein